MDNFGKLNLRVLQGKEGKIGVERSETKKLMFSQKKEQEFGEVLTTKGTLRNFEYGVKFKDDFDPFQRKGRKVPINRQPAVQRELTKLIYSGHLRELVGIGEVVCVNPAVVAKKSAGSVEFALDAK